MYYLCPTTPQETGMKKLSLLLKYFFNIYINNVLRYN